MPRLRLLGWRRIATQSLRGFSKNCIENRVRCGSNGEPSAPGMPKESLACHQQKPMTSCTYSNSLSKKGNQVQNRPHMIRNARLHRRSNPQGLVNPVEVAVHVV